MVLQSTVFARVKPTHTVVLYSQLFCTCRCSYRIAKLDEFSPQALALDYPNLCYAVLQT